MGCWSDGPAEIAVNDNDIISAGHFPDSLAVILAVKASSSSWSAMIAGNAEFGKYDDIGVASLGLCDIFDYFGIIEIWPSRTVSIWAMAILIFNNPLILCLLNSFHLYYTQIKEAPYV